MDLDKIRSDYQNRFNAKSIDVDRYRAALRNLSTDRLQEKQRMLLEHPSLYDRMREVKGNIVEGHISPSEKDEYYNKYVNVYTDDMLEIKLINEELDRRKAPITTGGMRPKYYHTTQFNSL